MINVFSAFDGMSCGQMALIKAGINDYTYYASEIDKYALHVTKDNFPKTYQLGDIKMLKSIKPKIDLMLGGSPCQDISGLKNNGKGLDGDKSSLFWEQLRLFKELKPKYFLFENVVPRKPIWLKQMNKAIGVNGVLINSDRFVHQNRWRYYWTNIPINPLPERPEWDREYWQFRRTYFRKNKSGVCPCLTANMGTGGHNVPLKSENKADKLTVREVADLQGMPRHIQFNVSNSQAYKMIGNGWTIPVIAHILRGIRW